MLWELRESALKPIALGGLVPEVLTDGQEPEVPSHQGTLDIDLHVSVELDASRRPEDLEPALRRAGYEPDPRARGGWQWFVRVDGNAVRVDFLCDNPSVEAEHVIAISDTLGVMDLRGTGYVLDDFEPRDLSGELRSGDRVMVTAYFAGLGGYLLSKVVAAVTRQKPKDFYDLVYVLLYNRAGGPREAAARIKSGASAKHVPELRTTLRELAERFRAADSVGSRSFVELHELASPGGDRSRLAEDAVAAVGIFTADLISE